MSLRLEDLDVGGGPARRDGPEVWTWDGPFGDSLGAHFHFEDQPDGVQLLLMGGDPIAARGFGLPVGELVLTCGA